MSISDHVKRYLTAIYGDQLSSDIFERLKDVLQGFHEKQISAGSQRKTFSEQDVILITYPDQFTSSQEKPLKTMRTFMDRYLGELINSVHVLPFFPFSSDEGFSIIDYRSVREDLGSWQDVRKIGDSYALMLDAVINHISQESDWFQAFLDDHPKYKDYFITEDPNTDLSEVVRPRTSPLLKEVDTRNGTQYVWTTFSEDQIDLNFANPELLLEIIALMLFYVEMGARIIRLDAVAYLWKEAGTSSIHRPQTHLIIKLLRAILDEVAPEVSLVTETNVPHEENIQYFGEIDLISGYSDEAQLIYQFPLAPLILHTFISENSQAITQWAKGISPPSNSTHFINFIASHDGIGLMPAKGLLTQNEIDRLVAITRANGGQISHKTNQDGSPSPYELNITLFDALHNPLEGNESADIQRFIASQAIMLSLAGIPGIYVHSLFGSRNHQQKQELHNTARKINRERFEIESLEKELSDPSSLKSQVFTKYLALLEKRKQVPPLHPNAPQVVLELGASFFGLLRGPGEQGDYLLSITNITTQPKTLELPLPSNVSPASAAWRDDFSGKEISAENGVLKLDLAPNEFLWLTTQGT